MSARANGEDGGHAREIVPGIGLPPQHVLENGSGEEGVDAAKTHVVDGGIDRLVRGIVAHVDD